MQFRVQNKISEALLKRKKIFSYIKKKFKNKLAYLLFWGIFFNLLHATVVIYNSIYLLCCFYYFFVIVIAIFKFL